MPVSRDEQQDGRRGAAVSPGPGEPGGEEVLVRDGVAESAIATEPVEVRRNAGLAALVGYAASGVAIAYLWRASQTMTVLDWALCGVMSVIAAVYLSSLVDSRTPLLVADHLGVRIRLGNEWRGLPWEAIGEVVVHPRQSALKDGRLVVVPRSLARAVEGLDARARRHVAMNQKMYGAALAVPLGSTTRVSSSGDAGSVGHASGDSPPSSETDGATGPDPAGSPERRIAKDISALALGRAAVVVLDPGTREEKAERRAQEGAGDATAADDPTDALDGERAEGATGHVAQDPSGALHGDTEGRAGTADPGEDGPGPAVGGRVVFPAVREGDTWDWRRSAGRGVAGSSDGRGSSEDASSAEGQAAQEAVDRGRTRDDGPLEGASPTPGEQPGTVPAQRPGARDEPGAAGAVRPPRRGILGGIGTIISRVAKSRSHDVDQGAQDTTRTTDQPVGQEATTPGERTVSPGEAGAAAGRADVEARRSAQDDRADESLPSTGLSIGTSTGTSADPGAEPGEPGEPGADPARRPAALRETRPALRAEATIDAAPTAGNVALDPSLREHGARTGLPEGRELRRPGSVDLVFERVEVEDRVRPISTLGDPVAPLVIDDYVTEPAYDPVIGPELAAARNRLGLSVDELAERTRIRPHVIESIEVDDFAPCGGDFYARGHLRTLARILGKDVEPLLAKFEERYATAPINARRVFEAELATGMTGSMRSTIGGPSWGLLIGVVLCLLLVWGVLRLFTTEPSDVHAPVVRGAAVSLDSDSSATLPGASWLDRSDRAGSSDSR